MLDHLIFYFDTIKKSIKPSSNKNQLAISEKKNP